MTKNWADVQTARLGRVSWSRIARRRLPCLIPVPPTYFMAPAAPQVIQWGPRLASRRLMEACPAATLVEWRQGGGGVAANSGASHQLLFRVGSVQRLAVTHSLGTLSVLCSRVFDFMRPSSYSIVYSERKSVSCASGTIAVLV